MVYEKLQPCNKYVRLSNNSDQDTNCAIIIARSLDIAILPTYSLINEGTHAVLMKTMEVMLSKCSLQNLLPLRGNYYDMIVLFLSAVKEQVK
jgi:hypothetical protein